MTLVFFSCTTLFFDNFIRIQLVRLISELPKMYREVLYYHFVLEFSIPETARGLGIKLATAKQRLVRGKKLLMQEIAKERSFQQYGND